MGLIEGSDWRRGTMNAVERPSWRLVGDVGDGDGTCDEHVRPIGRATCDHRVASRGIVTHAHHEHTHAHAHIHTWDRHSALDHAQYGYKEARGCWTTKTHHLPVLFESACNYLARVSTNLHRRFPVYSACDGHITVHVTRNPAYDC